MKQPLSRVVYSTEKSTKDGLRLLMAFVSEHVDRGYRLVNICNVGADSLACVLQLDRTSEAPREAMAGLID